MKTVIYARVSTETQEKQLTIESQLAELRRHAEAQGLTIAQEFVDDGYSGTTWTLSTAATSNAGQTLLGAAVANGQRWKARVQASDGIALSAWVESTPVTVNGGPPTRPTSVTLNPNPASPSTDLVAEGLGSTDPNSDPITYEYQWRVSKDLGVTWGAWTAGTAVQAKALLADSDYWQVQARANAAGQSSAWRSSVSLLVSRLLASTTPADAATGVASAITMNLNYPALPASFQANFSLAPAGGGTAVPGTFTWANNKQVTFTPGAALAANTSYVVTLAAGIQQRWSNPPLTWSESFSFTTVSSAVTVVSSSPSGTVPTHTPILIVFSQPMNHATTEASIKLSPGGTVTTMSWPDAVTLQITNWQGVPWPAGKTWTCTVRTTATALTGVPLAAAYTFSFTTGVGPALVMSVASAAKTVGPAAMTVNLTAAADVEMTVLNMAGRVVARTPLSRLTAGTNTLYWDGKSLSGTKVPAGQYLVRVTARSASGESAQCLLPLQR